MKLPRREFLHLAVALGALPVVSHSAKAQTYPSRPIRLIIGFTQGQLPTSSGASLPRARDRCVVKKLWSRINRVLDQALPPST